MDSPAQPAPRDAVKHRPLLRGFNYLVLLATFTLILIGGKVTSFEFGMAIPEGWTTDGVISFLAPLEYWFHDPDKFWEHTHRIMGTIVGFLTIGMAAWLLIVLRDRSKFSTDREKYGKWIAYILMLRISREGPRPWLRLSGTVMLLMVSFQGYLGATRVNDNSLTYAFAHGIGGQLILCGWIVIAVALSKPWLSRLGKIVARGQTLALPKLRWAVRVLLILLIGQLALGSAVRHFKADKAIPDFPLTLGQVVPPMSQEAVDKAYVAYYAGQMGVSPEDSGVTNRTPQGQIVVAVGDVHLHFAHRIGAYTVFFFGIAVAFWAIRRSGDRSAVVAPALLFMLMMGTQVALGIMTVLSETDPFMATLHQATGAALIATATWLAVRIHLAEYSPTPAMADNPISGPSDTASEPADRTPVTAPA